MDYESIKNMYLERFGIPPRIVDLLSVEEFIKLCVYGLSNKNITEHCESDETYISNVLSEFINFAGWQEDLDFNPWYFYQRVEGDYDKYLQEVAIISPVSDLLSIKIAYRICRCYADIIKELEAYGY